LRLALKPRRPVGSRFAVALGLGLILTGCTTEPAKLSLTSSVTSNRSVRARGEAVVQVAIAPVEDQRPHGHSLGQVGGRAFESGELTKWVGEELCALSTTRFACLPLQGTAATSLTLRPRLLKAYVDSVDIAKTAVVVLEIDFIGGDGAIQTHIYRGQLAGANWASTAGEVSRALHTALKRCLVRVQADIEAHLGNTREN
jgi:hypothetical protein